jgi:sirohydrochlorin ferrochelatase
MRPARLAVTLTAHGSRDPRAARATEALSRAVAARHPAWEIRASYLDHAGPRPREVLAAFAGAGHRSAVLLPLLLTSAYHGRVDVPGEITAARAACPGLRVEQADVLGPVAGQVPELLIDGLASRLGYAGEPAGDPGRERHGDGGVGAGLASAGPGSRPDAGFANGGFLSRPGDGSGSRPAVAGLGGAGLDAAGLAVAGAAVAGLDAVVLAAAGTRNAGARATVDQAAAALSARLGLPCRVAYASAAPPLSGDAVRDLRAEGHERIGLASYFLAPGLLWDSALASARAAGVCAVAEPLTDIPAIAELVSARVLEAAARLSDVGTSPTIVTARDALVRVVPTGVA